MEALGIPFDLGPEEAARSLREHGFAFFFAPKYHPAFRHIIPARKLCAERGQSTIFNFLGPLLNPARPTAALVGVPRPSLCEPLARVLQSLGMRRAMVVCGAVPGEAGAVHLSMSFHPRADHDCRVLPGTRADCFDAPARVVPAATRGLADLRGGDREVNATIIRRILCGEERGRSATPCC